MQIKIRKVTINDLHNLTELLKSKELGEGYSTEYYLRLIRDIEKSVFLVAEYKREIVGLVFGEYSKEEDWAELIGVSVKRGYRNQGIGFKLIKKFEEIIKSKRIGSIEILCNVNTLAKCIQKLGYKKGETYIQCSKDLK